MKKKVRKPSQDPKGKSRKASGGSPPTGNTKNKKNTAKQMEMLRSKIAKRLKNDAGLVGDPAAKGLTPDDLAAAAREQEVHMTVVGRPHFNKKAS
jgi:hypothetical protein